MIPYNSKGTLSPRLARIMAKLAKVIQSEDLMASVVITDGKTGEHFSPVDADWSAVRLRPSEDGGQVVHIRSKRRDYKTELEQKDHIEKTVNGLALMFKMVDIQRGNLALIMETLQEKLDFFHTNEIETHPAPKPLPPDQQPQTLADAAHQLAETLDKDQKMWVETKPLYEALREVHHGFGTELRNSWDLWNPEHPLRKHIQERYKLFGHADDISTLIFTALWSYIRGTDPDPDIEAEVFGMKEHWRGQGINPETGEKGLVL